MKRGEVQIRCGGACCQRFTLPHAPEALQDRQAQIIDGEQIAAMVIFIETTEEGGHYYTCRNLTDEGLCGVYAERPKMCREFPYGRACPFPDCTEGGTE